MTNLIKLFHSKITNIFQFLLFHSLLVLGNNYNRNQSLILWKAIMYQICFNFKMILILRLQMGSGSSKAVSSGWLCQSFPKWNYEGMKYLKRISNPKNHRNVLFKPENYCFLRQSISSHDDYI